MSCEQRPDLFQVRDRAPKVTPKVPLHFRPRLTASQAPFTVTANVFPLVLFILNDAALGALSPARHPSLQRGIPANAAGGPVVPPVVGATPHRAASGALLAVLAPVVGAIPHRAALGALLAVLAPVVGAIPHRAA